MKPEERTHLLLSAQQALLGNVTPNLRSFSVEEDGKVIRTLAVFAEPPSEHEVELNEFAGTELIAHYFDAQIEEQVEVSQHQRPPHLTHVIYRRYEPADGI